MTTIVVATVAAMVTSGGVAVAELVANADKVDGYHANQLIRAAVSRKDNESLVGPGSGNVRQVTITLPRKGLLLITASSDVFLSLGVAGPSPKGIVSGSFAQAQCRLEVNGTYLPGTARIVRLFSSGSGENSEEDCNTNGSWPLAAGTYTVSFSAEADAGAIFDESSLEALYVPFDKDGDPVSPQPLPAEVAPVQRGPQA